MPYYLDQQNLQHATTPHAQQTYLLRSEVLWLKTRIQLLAKLARRVLPDLAVLLGQPVFLLREPVGLVSACSGDEVDFEAGVAEDVEGMQGFGYEEACHVCQIEGFEQLGLLVGT